MLKYVKNVTSKDYVLKGEINTVNGRTPITIRIIKGGIYEIDTHIRYANLEEALNAGDLVPAYEDKSEAKVATPDVAPKAPKVEVTEPVVTEEPVSEVPDIAEDEIPEVDVEEEPTPEEKSEPVENVADSIVIPEEAPFICPYCGGEYASRNNLIRHIENKHSNPEQ